MKKTILFMVVAMSLSFGASAQEIKSGNGLDKLFELSSKDVPNKSSVDEIKNLFSLKKGLPFVNEKVSDEAEKAKQAQRNTGMALRDAAFDWEEITLPYVQTLTFSEANAVALDDWGLLGFCFKFTLLQPAVVGFISDTGKPYFTLYKDDGMAEQIFAKTAMYSVLQAGTYYLKIDDEWTWRYSQTELVSEIFIQALEPQSVSLPYDGNFSLTSDTPQLMDAPAVAYEFETSGTQLVDFSVTAKKVVVGIVSETGSLMNVTNSNYLLSAGKYYAIVLALEAPGTGEISGNLKIRTNTSYSINELTLPYQSDFSLSQSNSVSYTGIQSLIYSFTLPETRPVRITWTVNNVNNDEIAMFIIYDENGKMVDGGIYGMLLAKNNYPAGKYYLQILDYNGIVSGSRSLTGNFKLEMLKIYSDWDYSETLTLDHNILGSHQTMVPAVIETGKNAMIGQGFNFNVEAGKYYELKWTAYISDEAGEWGVGVCTLKDPLTGDYTTDKIQAYSGFYYNTASGTGSLIYIAAETATINGFFTYHNPLPSKEVMFELSMKEITTTYTEPASGGNTGFTWDEMTLPFVSYLHFDPSYPNVATINLNGWSEDIVKGFKLTLTEKTEVSFDYGVDIVKMTNFFIYFYTDEALTNCVTSSWQCGMYQDSKVVLDPGTYYVLLSDAGTNYWSDGRTYMSSGLNVISGTTDFITENVITLEELLSSDIPEVSYTNDLIYSKSSYYIKGLTAVVQGGGLFQYNGLYYGQAYKLTGMQADDAVNITQYSNRGDLIFVYKKAADGTISQVAKNESYKYLSDSDWAAKTELSFTADAAADYYIVVSPYSETKYTANKVAYNTIIWKNGDDVPQPQTPQLPGEVRIVSTEASASQITVPENVTETQIRKELVALDITGMNVLDENVDMKNNPSGWVISEDGTYATFANLGIPYEATADYVGAVVDIIQQGTGISKTNVVKVELAPNPAKDFITVFGLNGGETVRISDISGRQVFVGKMKNSQEQIDITRLKAGVYIVHISRDEKAQSVKLIVKP